MTTTAPNNLKHNKNKHKEMSQALLSTAYFGPIQWYQKLFRYDKVQVEACENFIKQTYRNRCVIATTNGLQALTVPVERADAAMPSADGTATAKCLIKDVRISDHGNWRHLHWNALLSAYGESPFFEFYADDIRPFFERKWTFLYDFNAEICAKMCELIGLEPNVGTTNGYITADEAAQNGIDDYREAIRPKHPREDASFAPRRYYQVYERKHGFQPNLSILDLLFNMGNESLLFL